MGFVRIDDGFFSNAKVTGETGADRGESALIRVDRNAASRTGRGIPAGRRLNPKKGGPLTDVRLDSRFDDAAGELSDAAFRTHVEALCWVVRNRTGGYINADDLRRFTGRADRLPAVEELVDAQWWATRLDDPGWIVVHDMPAQKMPGRTAPGSPSGWAAPPEGTSPWTRPAGHVWASAVYRFGGDGGLLLYIGVADDPAERFRGHRHDKPWWTLVRYVDIEWYIDRPAAESEESRAIEAEASCFNVRGVPAVANRRLASPTGQANQANGSSKPIKQHGLISPRVRVYRSGGV
jgi:hypothetical protein